MPGIFQGSSEPSQTNPGAFVPGFWVRWCDPHHLTDGETEAQTDMTGPKSHEQELAFKARSVGCRSHTLSPRGPRATLVTHPEPSPRPTCWPAGYHSGWWCHRGSRTAGGCCLWEHRGRWKLNGAAKPGSPQALSPCHCWLPTPAPTPAPHLHWQLTLSIAPFREVLALHDLLYDVISVNARVIHPGRVALHRVLLPPGVGRESGKSHDHRTQSPSTALRTLRVHLEAGPDMFIEPSHQLYRADAAVTWF